MKTYVLQAFMETPWAILPSKLAMLDEIVTRHVNGEKLSAEEIQARVNGAVSPQNTQINNVAVLRVFGTIAPRTSMLTNMSGGTTAEALGRQFDEFVKDPQVSAIVLDVNSPGGQVGGIEELSNKIFGARGTKPIVAVANHLMASAAYWIGTAADEIVVTPSGEVGSIGVFAAHQDISAQLEKDGIKVSLIKAGKYKAEANPYEPLTDEARAAIQQNVSEIYGSFVDAVARNRAVKPATVRNGFGEGRVVSAKQAVELGMADRIGTLDYVINQLLNNSTTPATTQANQIINEPQVLSPRVEPVEVESIPGASNQAETKPDPRKVQRKYLYVQK